MFNMTKENIKGLAMEPITSNPVVSRVVNYLSHGSMFGAIFYAYMGVQPYLAKIDTNEALHRHEMEWRAQHTKRAHEMALTLDDLTVLISAIKISDPGFDSSKVYNEILIRRMHK